MGHGRVARAANGIYDLDISNRILTSPYVAVIEPERKTDVPVELETFESEPNLDLEIWDHVAEARLELLSGKLEIHECTGGSIDQISLTPGSYRVRAFSDDSAESAMMGLRVTTIICFRFGPLRSRPSRC